MNYSVVVKKLFELENFDEIIHNEINFFFFIQQMFFLLFIYLTTISFNLLFGDSSITKTLLILISGFFLFIFINRKKYTDRFKNRKNRNYRYTSNFIFKIIKNHYKFKIMRYLTGRYDIYQLILSKISYLNICELLLKNNKISDDKKRLIESFLVFNMKNMTSSDVFYMADLDINEHYTFKNIRNIIVYSNEIRIQKIQENIKNY